MEGPVPFPSSPLSESPKQMGAINDAIFIVTDAPSGLDFGIDCMSYETGKQFRGITMIPPGLHFIFHSSGMGARQGFFLFANKNDVHVRSWNAENEEISADNILSDESTETLLKALNRGDLNQQLGPYPFSQHSVWTNLSNYMTDRVLERAESSPGTLMYV